MTTETVRKELLKMHDSERQSMRCTMAHDLKKEAEVLTATIDSAISVMVEKIDLLNSKISETDTELRSMRAERGTMLDEAKLNNMHRTYSCSITELHPSLVEFDTESDAMRKEILLRA